MLTKPPFAGDQYRSNLHPGQTCRVIRVVDSRITFQWLGQYGHIDQQTTSVKQFLIDFKFVKADPKA